MTARPFAGWQRQDNGPSVQAVARTCDPQTARRNRDRSRGAGRTDAGVHAFGQVAHADIEKPMAPDKMRDALNAHLRPHPVAVLRAEEVATEIPRALRRDRAALSLSHRQPAQPADARSRQGLAGADRARRRGDARGGAASRRAITTSRPSAPPSARRSRR